MSTTLRLYETLRHLRPIQLVSRVKGVVIRPSLPTPDGDAVLALPANREKWVAPVARPRLHEGEGTFRFLNVAVDMAESSCWTNPALPKLLRYNLHYFDDLNARDAASRKDMHLVLMRRWIAENPAPEGDGWEPYPISVRVVNWLKWALREGHLPDDITRSIAMQVQALTARLETHLLADHYYANGKALCFAGLLYSGGEAEKWLRLGRRIIQAETAEQFLADGGHYERSPMYHNLGLEDLLDLINVFRAADAPAPPGVEAAALLALQWAGSMRHPDGGVAFFNDSAHGVAPPKAELDGYADRLGFEVRPATPAMCSDGVSATDLEASGYARLENAVAQVLLADAAPLAVDYQPGHAHADTLSFELSIGERRVIVNGGTSQYGVGEERDLQRATKSHSTVMLGGENSSDVWKGFRVGHRARIVARALEQDSGGIALAAAHDGYRFLPGRWTHHRRWHMRRDGVAITDTLFPQRLGQKTTLESRLILHPDVALDEGDGESVIVEAATGLRLAILRCSADFSVERCSYWPEFGVRKETTALVFRDMIDRETRIFIDIATVP